MALRSVLICFLAAIPTAMCAKMRRIGQPLVSTHLRLLASQALVGLAQAGQWGEECDDRRHISARAHCGREAAEGPALSSHLTPSLCATWGAEAISASGRTLTSSGDAARSRYLLVGARLGLGEAASSTEDARGREFIRETADCRPGTITEG
jgi:hypothetical protein